MPTENKYKCYLQDFGFLVGEMAMEAAKNKRKEPSEYNVGYLMGFYTVITLMQDQAKAFGIPLNELKVENINPDKDLL